MSKLIRKMAENEYMLLLEIWMLGGNTEIGKLISNLTQKYGKSRATWYTYIHRLEDKKLICIPKRNMIQTEICYADITCEYVDYLFDTILKLGIDRITEDKLQDNLNNMGYQITKMSEDL